ncbi:MAG TPA: response regulator [Gammaproteobacteria bacterium]|nr:response regulator [Gammaproteobacteria bacterium]
MSEPIRVLIADDHRLVRAGLSELLRDQPGIEVVGEAEDGEAVLELTPRLQPNVILMDVQMPRLGGIEATRRLNATQPEARVIAISALDADPVPARIMEAGAWGFLGKSAEPAEVIAAVRRVADGERYVPAALAKRLALSQRSGEELGQFMNLSRRELELVLYTAQGLGTLAVAQRLCLSPKTVSTYRRRVYDKLGVDNDIDLVKLAAGHGLITLDMPSVP